MGNPIIPPPPTYTRGVQCGLCEPVHWPNGSTPASWIALVFGVQPCNGYESWEVNFQIQLNQVPGHPCRFLGNDFLSNTVYWNEATPFPPLVATFFLSEEPGGDDILYDADFDCPRSGISETLVCDPGIAGHTGGWTIHTYSPVDYVGATYNFVPPDDTLSDIFSIPDGDAVFRYASKKYSINVKIRVDPTLLPTDQEGIF